MTNPRATRKCMLRRFVFEFSGHCLARQMKRCNAIARFAPCDIFQRFRFCKSSWLRHIWCGRMFSWQRDQRVLGPVSPLPPIFTIQQALKHDSCPFITTSHNSLKKMLWNPTRETVVRLGKIQQQLETFRAEANCRWGRPRPNLLLGVLP